MSTEYINEYSRLFEEFGGELLSADLDAGSATIAFNSQTELDSFNEMIDETLVARIMANFKTEIVDGRYIVTITNRLDAYGNELEDQVNESD